MFLPLCSSCFSCCPRRGCSHQRGRSPHPTQVRRLHRPRPRVPRQNGSFSSRWPGQNWEISWCSTWKVLWFWYQLPTKDFWRQIVARTVHKIGTIFLVTGTFDPAAWGGNSVGATSKTTSILPHYWLLRKVLRKETSSRMITMNISNSKTSQLKLSLRVCSCGWRNGFSISCFSTSANASILSFRP